MKGLLLHNITYPNHASTDDGELPVKRDKTWVHMDDVEADKMRWMKDLPPPPTADNKVSLLFLLLMSLSLMSEYL